MIVENKIYVTIKEYSTVIVDGEGGSSVPFLEVTPSGDDAGLICTGQFSVGKPNNPKEFVAGGGDSYSLDKDGNALYGYTILQTDDDVSYTDVSQVAGSDSGSTFGMFNGTSAGKTIYAGADYGFSGVKLKISEFGDIDPLNVVSEFWDGSQWRAVRFMSTSSNPPLRRFGDNIANNGVDSEQVRFDFDPYGRFPDWTKSTIDGKERFWARFRIESDITTDPTLEQIKLHTDRYEVNPNGSGEWFGSSRPERTILSGVNNFISNSKQTAKNQKVLYTTDVEADYKNNKFEDGSVDSKLIVLDMIEGLDTSVVLEIAVSYYVDGDSTGDVEFEASRIVVDDGFVYDGSGVEEGSYKAISSTVVESNKVRGTTRMYLDVSDAKTDTADLIVIRRDARATNPLDTVADNVIISHIRINGHFWK